jgi:hypothetical protein
MIFAKLVEISVYNPGDNPVADKVADYAEKKGQGLQGVEEHKKCLLLDFCCRVHDESQARQQHRHHAGKYDPHVLVNWVLESFCFFVCCLVYFSQENHRDVHNYLTN